MAVTGYSYTSVYFLTCSSNTVTYQKFFMLSVIVPLVKCKTKDLSDVDNITEPYACQAQFLSYLNLSLQRKLQPSLLVMKYNLVLKLGFSTGLCTKVLKTTVDYYSERGSHVFLLFSRF